MSLVLSLTDVQSASISVIVPTYRRPEALAACLAGLACQSVAPLEVIVVVREGDIGTRAVISSARGDVRVVMVAQPGMVAAVNCGLAAARGSLVAMTDDDAVPHPDWLKRMVARFATDERIGAVGGRDVVRHGSSIDDGVALRVGRILPWGRRVGNHHLQSSLQDVDFLKGVNMGFRTSALRPFDPHLRGEGAQVCCDLEVSWAVRRRGWRVVYDPAVVVDHYPAARHDEDARRKRSTRAERNEAHNEMYALLRHAAVWHKPVIFVYRLLVGTRLAPGLLLALCPGLPPRSRGLARQLAAARISALDTLWKARRGSRLARPTISSGDPEWPHS